MEKFEIIAKTFQGIEDVLAGELEELGAENISKGHRMVTFTGDKEMLYRANFCLRTAVRVLKPILHFNAKTADDVYDAVRKVEWSDIIDLTTSFSVYTVSGIRPMGMLPFFSGLTSTGAEFSGSITSRSGAPQLIQSTILSFG